MTLKTDTRNVIKYLHLLNLKGLGWSEITCFPFRQSNNTTQI